MSLWLFLRILIVGETLWTTPLTSGINNDMGHITQKNEWTGNNPLLILRLVLTYTLLPIDIRIHLFNLNKCEFCLRDQSFFITALRNLWIFIQGHFINEGVQF